MARKIRRTANRTSRSTDNHTTVNNELGSDKVKKSQQEDDEWGPLISLAKKAAKGAVKGAAKELHKK